jgi:hypothetical protein
MFPFRRAMIALILFGVAFGYLEGAVVTYLRALHEPARLHYYPNRAASEMFPLLTLDQLRTAAPGQQQTLYAEIGREAATILMLAAMAVAVARNGRQWSAAFAIVFGIWDGVFYLTLKLLLDWPASWLTWDILFLIPLPWVGPVAAPVLVALAMIAGGTWCLWRESRGAPLRVGGRHSAGVLFGAFIIIVSFTLDYRNILGGGTPRPFHWGVFAAGMIIGMASYGAAGISRVRT